MALNHVVRVGAKGVAAGVAAVALLMLNPSPAGAKDLNCSDFTYQHEAQAVLDQDPSDPNGLDADGNGIVCESLPTAANPPPSATHPGRSNQPPVGGIVLSLTDGRSYGMLAWAVDPETGGPTRMRVHIPNVITQEYDWNYIWADMPFFTGVNRNEAFVFLAQLPPGEHHVCLDAQDPQNAAWVNIGCKDHTVK